MFSFALRIVTERPLAEEILQEAFFRAWQQGGSFSSGRGTFITWLLSITHNLSIDEIRRRRRRPQKADSEEPEQILDAVADTGPVRMSRARSGSERCARRSVGRWQRVAASATRGTEMAYFRGMTQREIAEALGEPRNDQDEDAPRATEARGCPR